MKKSKVILSIIIISSIFLSACRNNDGQGSQGLQDETSNTKESGKNGPEVNGSEVNEASKGDGTLPGNESHTQDKSPIEQIQPENQPVIEEADLSAYFEGITGGAVIFDPNQNKYTIYNEDICNIRRSPCSTFKIISSLTGIENGLISDEDSTRKWSGEVFWNEKWNRDIDFKQAFQSSCIWYFREVTNELGQDVMQNELDRLEYGNCDISDWEGYLNNNNNNRSLTGFWVESSLKISPKEQTQVLERIFGDGSTYQETTLELLKDAMIVDDPQLSDGAAYGKTGLGMSNGIVVDAWFTGFTEADNIKKYFCVYLGETDNKEVSSTIAKKIALQLIKDKIIY